MPKFLRIPLSVGVIYSKSGRVLPRTVIFEGERFPIDKILFQKKKNPLVVPCIAPLEFTVLIGGQEKKIYFEKDTGKWFSVLKCEGAPTAENSALGSNL